MEKLKAIWKLIFAKHFYLVTCNEKLQSTELYSTNSEQKTIASMIQLYWMSFWRGVFISNVENGIDYV